MPRRFLSELAERETISEVFLLGDKQLRHNRNGNLYLQMRLSDKSASANAMLWNAKEDTGADLSNGDYVHVDGTTQLFNGSLQLIVTKIRRVDPQEINEEDYVQMSRAEMERLKGELRRMLDGIANPHLRALADEFLADETFMDKFCRAPAAIKNHHAHHGGLLDHVVSLMGLTQPIAQRYTEIDADLLLVGAFLHDVGKIDELRYSRDLGYTDAGQLIGHLVMGVSILEQKIASLDARRSEPFPQELALRIKHMIVSHHGKLEFGSPKIPMTPEALALHYLDDLDAKLQLIRQLVAADANMDSAWTTYDAQFGRKIFKGGRTGGDMESEPSP
jgi:3'-5' exoribonuclease